MNNITLPILLILILLSFSVVAQIPKSQILEEINSNEDQGELTTQQENTKDAVINKSNGETGSIPRVPPYVKIEFGDPCSYNDILPGCDKDLKDKVDYDE